MICSVVARKTKGGQTDDSEAGKGSTRRRIAQHRAGAADQRRHDQRDDADRRGCDVELAEGLQDRAGRRHESAERAAEYGGGDNRFRICQAPASQRV